MIRLALVTLGLAVLAACIVEEDGDLDNANACDRTADYAGNRCQSVGFDRFFRGDNHCRCAIVYA